MEQDKQHLQNIDKVEIHEHVDTGEILSLLHTLKMQNNKILHLIQSSEDDEETKTEIMRKLNKLIVDVKSTV